MQKKIILICGGMRAGKDTFADFCIEYLESLGKTCAKICYADPIRQLVRKVEELTGHKIGKNRELMQWIGGVWGRGVDEGLWVKKLEKRVACCCSDFVFATDVRYENELSPLVDRTKNIFLVDASETLRIDRGAEKEFMEDKSEQLHKSFFACEVPISDTVYIVENEFLLSDLQHKAIKYCNLVLLA